MGAVLTWERTEDNGSVGVTVSDGTGPVTGATVVARFRDPDSADLWLDHNDGAWKANASVTTLDLSLGEVDATDAPGRYEANLNFGATTGFPAASHRIEVTYVVTSPAGFPTDTDVVQLVGSFLDSPGDVWDEDVVAAHGTSDTAGLLLRALGALISQRTNNATLAALLGVADSPGVDLPEQVDTELSAAHGSGAWDGTESDWSATEREQIRFRLAMDGTQTNPTTNTGTIEDILADTSAVDARLPSDPADESLQQASHAQTQADIAALNNLSQADVQSALTAQGYTAARATLLDNLDAAVSAVLAAVAALNDLDATAVENAVWDASQAAHVGAGTTGESLNNAGAGSGGDWTDAEQEQIRDALGIDGTKTSATGGQLQGIQNQPSGAGFDPETDSLEAIRNRIG